jgi:DNA invertase Pin-like site-specific DNA recombinase
MGPASTCTSTSKGLDTRTPASKALFGMLGMFAEFERSMVQERVRAGMAKAMAKGTKSGNPIGRPMVAPSVEARIHEPRADGLGMIKIAVMAGRGVSTVQRVLAADARVVKIAGGSIEVMKHIIGRRLFADYHPGSTGRGGNGVAGVNPA